MNVFKRGKATLIMGDPWRSWLEALQSRLGLSDTGMAAQIGVSSMTYWGWKNKGTKPRYNEQLDKLVEMSGEERSVIYGLAGRGFIGMDSDLSPEAIKWAYDIQSILDNVDDPEIREIAFQQLKAGVGTVKDLIERLIDLREALTPKK